MTIELTKIIPEMTFLMNDGYDAQEELLKEFHQANPTAMVNKIDCVIKMHSREDFICILTVDYDMDFED